jgi:hypothetical protein
VKNLLFADLLFITYCNYGYITVHFAQWITYESVRKMYLINRDDDQVGSFFR